MRPRARLFKWSRATVGRLPLARAAHSAAWLRLLDPDDLNALTLDSYSNAAASGFEREDHNLRGVWPWEEAAFDQFLAGRRRILVAGAGGGREMIALARAGHRVVGFDASADLAAACRAHLREAGVEGAMLTAPPGQVPADIGRHDGLVIGRGVYHHFPRRARRIEFLAACRAALEPGSPLVMGDVLTRSDDGARPSPRTIERGDHVGSAFFHYFTPRELADELGQAGFDLVEHRVTPFGDDTQLAHLIARSRA